MIELITARGNTSLESCVNLTKTLRRDIQNLGQRLARAASDAEDAKRKGWKSKPKDERSLELKLIVKDMRALLERVEDAVPLINLAITTSGVSLSTSLPASISPSRLLQASTFLSAGDAQYASKPSAAIQIGPTFTLSMYMLFSGHAHEVRDEESVRTATWQEVMHKAKVRLSRTPMSSLGHFTSDGGDERLSLNPDMMSAEASADEFAYQISIIEDLDDGRHHGDVEACEFEGVQEAGIREIVPIHQIAKIFYADTGKILNIGGDGETNNPVLLLKRDTNAAPPRRMIDPDDDDTVHDDRTTASDVHVDGISLNTETNAVTHDLRDPWQLPSGLDPEWIALEVYNEVPESDEESEADEEDAEISVDRSSKSESPHGARQIMASMSELKLSSAIHHRESPSRAPKTLNSPQAEMGKSSAEHILPYRAIPSIRTSLSLLEMLVRLTSLQQFQQASHLTITDELLNFFLEESSTTGAGSSDTDERKRTRMDARYRIGFDPYDESPVKKRGEDYQYRQSAGWNEQQDSGAEWVEGSSQSTTGSSLPSTPHVLRTTHADSSPLRRGTPGTHGSIPTRSSPRSPHNLRNQRTEHVVTPPATTKSREAFLRDESSNHSPSRSSPLASGTSGKSGEADY